MPTSVLRRARKHPMTPLHAAVLLWHDWLFHALGASIALYAVGMWSGEDVVAAIGWISTGGFAVIGVYQRWRQVCRQEAAADEQTLHNSLARQNAILTGKLAKAVVQIEEGRRLNTGVIHSLQTRIGEMRHSVRNAGIRVPGPQAATEANAINVDEQVDAAVLKQRLAEAVSQIEEDCQLNTDLVVTLQKRVDDLTHSVEAITTGSGSSSGIFPSQVDPPGPS